MTAAGIVLYNPDIERLKENINEYVNDVEKIYCFDNNSDNIEEIEKIFLIWPKICLIKGERNYGVAFALNRIMEKAQKDKFEWVLTMDQDSVCQKNMLSRLQVYCREPQLGIICPFVLERGGSRKEYEGRKKTEFVERCITSASLTNVQAWDRVGGFDEWMFIDMVDFEFCAKLCENGYKILRVNDTFLLQSVGKLREIVVRGRHIYVRNHAAIRRYYWARNQIYCHKLHPYTFTYRYLCKNFLSEIAKIILFEQEKLHKICAVIRGLADGKRKVQSFHV